MIRADDLVTKFRYALDNKWGYIWGTAGILWTQARQNQKVNYMVSKYGTSWQKNSEAKDDNYYGAAMYGSKWIGHTVADCSGLFVWAFEKLGGKIYHGSNSIYDRYCTSKGKITDEIRKAMEPGTAVFVCKSTGNKSHIGLYIGDGKVIEASGTQAGVCVSDLTAGKWTYYGLLKDVEYSGDVLPTLRRGDKGAYVTKAQTLLKQQGYDLGPCGVDGDFGKATENAVRQFQTDWGITADGVIGPNTWAVLTTIPVSVKYSVTIPGLDLSQAKALCNNYPGSTMKEMV